MGEVFLRGKIWWIRYYDQNGRRHPESSRSKKKGDADRLLKIREGDIAKGLPVTPALSRFTFDQGVVLLVNDYTIKKRKTLDITKARIANHLTPVFGGRRLSTIVGADIDAFTVTRREAGASDGEIRLELAALKRIFRLALRGGKLLHMPYITMPPPGPARKGFFEWDEFVKVRDQFKREPLADIATMAYCTGWRTRSEILPLEWPQVDRERGTIKLETGTTKNDEPRLFPYTLLPELAAAITRRWAARDALAAKGVISPYVFFRYSATTKQARRVKGFRKAWETACEAAGCPEKIVHDFRRTAVRNLVRAGVAEKTAMLLTGHKTRAVFDRYDIVDETDLRNAVQKLAGTKRVQSDQKGEVKGFRKARK